MRFVWVLSLHNMKFGQIGPTFLVSGKTVNFFGVKQKCYTLFHTQNEEKQKNIAKGATDPGVDCFNKVNHSKNHATPPQATQPLSHHTITLDIAHPMVTNSGNQQKLSGHKAPYQALTNISK